MQAYRGPYHPLLLDLLKLPPLDTELLTVPYCDFTFSGASKGLENLDLDTLDVDLTCSVLATGDGEGTSRSKSGA